VGAARRRGVRALGLFDKQLPSRRGRCATQPGRLLIAGGSGGCNG
jgi:hypothetical protein